MAASTVPLGTGLARQAGMLPVAYSGPQWPFMYAYRSAARGRRLEELRRALKDFA